ncbi:mitochondrial recN domain-containing protein [Andalucia godoyi]|uniref:Mitochondrial recN domain-containing protein n=1 Tax=Andalucia godoyi TaxID=505711 RepID=A0A8K0AHK7_ANDGO|nr:mitochondrial recN domain-containing protein [Andalucia godoyi]|eukprot:ANDGO_08024.mRNA.1 mitochondrial recN domain-containing protein
MLPSPKPQAFGSAGPLRSARQSGTSPFRFDAEGPSVTDTASALANMANRLDQLERALNDMKSQGSPVYGIPRQPHNQDTRISQIEQHVHRLTEAVQDIDGSRMKALWYRVGALEEAMNSSFCSVREDLEVRLSTMEEHTARIAARLVEFQESLSSIMQRQYEFEKSVRQHLQQQAYLPSSK